MPTRRGSGPRTKLPQPLRGRAVPPNRLIREYLPKGTDIVQHQPYLTAIAEELNTRPRACLGFYTPQEVFHRMLLDGGTGDNSESVASTN